MSGVLFYLVAVLVGAAPGLAFYVWLPELEEVDR